LSSLRLIRAGGIELSEGMRLIGDSQGQSNLVKLSRVQPSNDLVHCILAVFNPSDEDDPSLITESNSTLGNDIPQNLMNSNIAGFLWVVQLDIERDIMTVLAPGPGALPSKYLLVGSIKWVE
jgi:polyribonucleotide 5'-hydroxyl-kinase